MVPMRFKHCSRAGTPHAYFVSMHPDLGCVKNVGLGIWQERPQGGQKRSRKGSLTLFCLMLPLYPLYPTLCMHFTQPFSPTIPTLPSPTLPNTLHAPFLLSRAPLPGSSRGQLFLHHHHDHTTLLHSLYATLLLIACLHWWDSLLASALAAGSFLNARWLRPAETLLLFFAILGQSLI